MVKIEKQYQELYGDIPKTKLGRLDYILGQIRSKKSVQGKIFSEINRIRGIEWKTIDYVIYLVPKATPRPRTGRAGHFYVSGASDYKKIFSKFYEENQDLGIITTPCEFYCTSYLPIPKDMKILDQILAEIGFIYPLKKPDFDNLAKTYSDMIQGTLLYDDCLIIKGVSKKYYSVKPRIEIRLRYMVDYDCEYNRKKIQPKTSKK